MKNKTIDSTTPVFTLSTASTLSGIPIHSVRQYIDKGLLIPFKKDSNRHLFSQIDIMRLAYIQRLLNEDGLNIAGIKSVLAMIPCWAIRKCAVEERESCLAYHSNTNPCWEASEKGALCRNTNCRECDVYRAVEQHQDIKSLMKAVIPA